MLNITYIARLACARAACLETISISIESRVGPPTESHIRWHALSNEWAIVQGPGQTEALLCPSCLARRYSGQAARQEEPSRDILPVEESEGVMSGAMKRLLITCDGWPSSHICTTTISIERPRNEDIVLGDVTALARVKGWINAYDKDGRGMVFLCPHCAACFISQFTGI